jgi:hypothetical protein
MMADLFLDFQSGCQDCEACTTMFHDRYLAFKAAGREGCSACHVLSQGIRALIELYLPWPASDWISDIWINKLSPTGTTQFGNSDRGSLAVEFFVDNDRRHSNRNPLPIRRHLRCSDTPQAILNTARLALQHCIEYHEGCGGGAEERSPMRLIDVAFAEAGGDSVRIFKTYRAQSLLEPGPPFKYTALSYCWGSESAWKPSMLGLTKHSLHALRHGIEIQQLPQVFQDAIEVTRHLGYRFLWIDAMCIAQGDESGKSSSANESESKMFPKAALRNVLT